MAGTKASQVDLLIIGAGASGTMAATCCAAYGMRNVRVIDKRPAKISAGHADGFNARTIEILHSFGMYDRLRPEMATLGTPTFWNADAEGGTKMEMLPANNWRRSAVSRFGLHTLSQARMQDVLWTEYIEPKIGLQVDRGTITEKLEIRTGEEYPIRLTVRKTAVAAERNGSAGHNPDGLVDNEIRLDDDAEMIARSQQAGGEQEEIQAKYAIGCDGAHSWTRRQLDIPMLGDDTDMIWGVMDIKPVTDFPGARLINYIISKEEHSGLLWIPRERGLIRIYIALREWKKDSSPSSAKDSSSFRSAVTEESIFAEIKKNMKQYNISYSYCEWWAAYQIGQRVTPDNIDSSGRIYLAGDAVHTHSPKAGQGMNVSMADSQNLVWKLNLVLKGLAKPEILETYRTERLIVGQRLVSFDRAMAAFANGKPPPELPDGVAGAEDMVKSGQTAGIMLIMGMDVTNLPSIATTSTEKGISEARKVIATGTLPEGIVTGMRFPLYDVSAHADRRLLNIADVLRAEGCLFRIVLFVGDLAEKNKVERLYRVAEAIDGLHLPRNFMEVLTIHTTEPAKLTEWIRELPDMCHPLDLEKGHDYDKLFSDYDLVDQRGETVKSAYDMYKVDREDGRLVVVRPDGFVACQSDLENLGPVRNYFKAFLGSMETLNGVNGVQLKNVANGLNGLKE